MAVSRRRVLGLVFSVAAAVGVMGASEVSFASGYPERTITILTPVSPGSPFDSLTRIFAERLSSKLKVPVIVENAPGGQAMIATKKVLNAPADGYTLFLTSNGMATTPIVFKNAGYTLDDFTPIAPLGQAPYILFASASVQANDIPSLMKEINKRGKDMNHGILTSSHLSMVLAKKMAATAGGEPYAEVGYKGSPDMIRALLADDVQLIATTYSMGGPYLKDGKIKAIGVIGREKSLQMPELKTFIESGFEELYINVWAALYARSDVPKQAIEKLRKASAEVISEASYKEAMKPTGMEPWNITVEQMQPAFHNEAKTFKNDIEKFNLKLN